MRVVPPQMPAVPRDREANGCNLAHSMVQKAIKPGQGWSITCSVASGVTSRGEKPVPPVVNIKSNAAVVVDVVLDLDCDHSFSFVAMASMLSGTMAVSVLVTRTVLPSNTSATAAVTAGPDKSPVEYSPNDARSLTVKMPNENDAKSVGRAGG